MKLVECKTLNSDQKNSVYELWNNEYPKSLNYDSVKDFDDYLSTLTHPIHYLLIDDKQQLVAWGFEFEREGDKWFAIIVNSLFHSKGLGTKLLNNIKNNNASLNGWVIDHNNDLKLNGDTYKTPVQFYLKNQFRIESDTRLELSKISAVKIVWTINTNLLS